MIKIYSFLTAVDDPCFDRYRKVGGLALIGADGGERER